MKKPDWLRVKVNASLEVTEKIVRGVGLNTICEEAACPNITECWAQSHAAFMILGTICTRACKFCNVATGKPGAVDQAEPQKIANAVRKMNLNHVVITSVDRDDLPDGGAGHFADVIKFIRLEASLTSIEVLTPDFRNKDGALEIVVEAFPDVFNHNLETVPRLYHNIRPGARYFNSLFILAQAKLLQPRIFTKSGLMVGLGETDEEIYQVMDDLRSAKVDFLTIGQYLRPTLKHHPVERYVEPDKFDHYRKVAKAKGFLLSAAGPLVRSSYHAGEDFKLLKELRESGQSSNCQRTL